MTYAEVPYASTPYAGAGEEAEPPPSAQTDWPTLQIRFSPTTGPFETPAWVDITADVRARTSIRVRRGREHALDQFTAGTATFELDNTERQYDPLYTAGPYYGLLGPNIPVQVRATWAGVTYTLFTGLLDGLQQRYEKADNTASVFVTCTDLFKLLSRRDFRPARVLTLDRSDGSSALDSGNHLGDLRPAFDRERSGARIMRIVETIGVTDHTCDPGSSILVDDPVADTNVLDYVVRCARTENGRVFIDRHGAFRFQDRGADRRITEHRTSQATYGDDTAAYTSTYYDLGFDPSDERMIRNEVTRGREGREAVYRNRDSIAKYGTQSDSGTDLLFADLRDAADQAHYIVDRYSEPQPRIDRLSLKPRRWPAVQWPAALGYQIGYRITVERTPLGLGGVFSQESHIEQIEHTIDLARRDWITSWSLTKADLTEYLRLDYTDGTSTVDAGNILAY